MFRMPTGTFELEPLDSFTVTETDHRPKSKARISLREWLREKYGDINNWPIFVHHTSNTVEVDDKKPDDVDVYHYVFSNEWQIIWTK